MQWYIVPIPRFKKNVIYQSPLFSATTASTHKFTTRSSIVSQPSSLRATSLASKTIAASASLAFLLGLLSFEFGIEGGFALEMVVEGDIGLAFRAADFDGDVGIGVPARETGGSKIVGGGAVVTDARGVVRGI